MPECTIRYARVASGDPLNRHLQDIARETLAECLLEVLPDYIVAILNSEASTSLNIGELEIDIAPFSTAAYNVADLKITIATGIQAVWRNRLAIRTALRDRVLEWLANYAEQMERDLPSAMVTLEVSIYLSPMCGETFDIKNNELVDSWNDTS